MSAESARQLIETYYAIFNSGDREDFLALLTEDVAHDINQGEREIGKVAFRAFMARMDRCYREQIKDVVVMSCEAGDHAAAEFTVHGAYIKTDDPLPPATGQAYVLPAGAFFTVSAGKVARISNFYNLPDWVRQVSGGSP